MNKILLMTFFLSLPIFAYSQQKDHYEHDPEDYFRNVKKQKNQDTRVQRLDSIIGYYYSPSTHEYIPVGVSIYNYNTQLQCVSILGVEPFDRKNVYSQSYKYDLSGNNVEYIYREWTENMWKDIRRWEYLYNLDKHLIKEVHSSKTTSGGWFPYQQIFYNYENGRVINHLRQNLNSTGLWYNSAQHYYIYNSLGLLVDLYGEYVSNKIIFWQKTYNYYENGLCSENFLKILRYNAILKKNELVNSIHYVYFYDIFGDISEVHNYSWIGNAWQFTGKSVYHYSLIPNKKVNICHNGHQISVSTNAVRAHLEHGDKLGECALDYFDDVNGKKEKENEKSDKKNNSSAKFTAFPNPATDILTISLPDDKEDYTRGYIMSSGGRTVSSFDINGRSQITVDLTSLQTGTYFIRMVKKDKTETLTVIVK